MSALFCFERISPKYLNFLHDYLEDIEITAYLCTVQTSTGLKMSPQQGGNFYAIDLMEKAQQHRVGYGITTPRSSVEA